MALKGAKRAAQAAAPGAEPKKPKPDPNVAGVLDALQQAQMPEDTKSMLIAMAPLCFSASPGPRHGSQAMVAAWIGEVLEGTRAKLQDELDAVDREVAGAKASKESRERGVAEAEAALSAGEEAFAAKDAALAEADKAVAEAHRLLTTVEGAQEQAGARLAEAGKDKDTLQVLVQEAALLTDERAFEASLAEKFLAALTPMAPRLRLEDSLTLALPMACMRRPAERSVLEQAALEQLGPTLREKIGELEAELQAGPPRAEDSAEAVAAARRAAEAAEEGQRVAGAEKDQAEAERQRFVAALAVAEAAAAALARSRAAAEAARQQKAAALQNFAGYNMECYALLLGQAATAGA